jgi:hypothetical protein
VSLVGNFGAAEVLGPLPASATERDGVMGHL